MSPLICPQPGPRDRSQDCPLLHQRATTPDEQLRRAVLRDQGRKANRDLAALIHAEASGTRQKPTTPATPPTRPELPPPSPLVAPILDPMKGVTHD